MGEPSTRSSGLKGGKAWQRSLSAVLSEEEEQEYTRESDFDNNLHEEVHSVPKHEEGTIEEVERWEPGAGDAPWHGGAEIEAAQDWVTQGYDDEVVLADGSRYTGQMLDGRQHGRGHLVSPKRKDDKDEEKEEEEYVGQWEYGMRHGEGLCCFPNGQEYQGQFVDDLQCGRGRCTWPDGRKYEGEWKNGNRSGKAVYKTTQGRRWRGIWHDDMPLKCFEYVDDPS